MHNDSIKAIGKIEIKKFLCDELIETYNFKNLITDIGLDTILKLIGGDNTMPINKLAIGDGNTSASALDTKLANKVLLIDVQKDYSIKGRINFLANIPANTFNQLVNYKEAGLTHKGTSTEILISRVVFDNVVYQKPENSLSILYSLELRV